LDEAIAVANEETASLQSALAQKELQERIAQADSDRIDREQDEQMQAEEHPENDDAYTEANTPATF
jgi:hypothetical protein